MREGRGSVGKGRYRGNDVILFLKIVVWQPFYLLVFNHCACRRSARRIA